MLQEPLGCGGLPAQQLIEQAACADERVSKGVAPASIASASAAAIEIRVMAAQVSFRGCWYDDKLGYLRVLASEMLLRIAREYSHRKRS